MKHRELVDYVHGFVTDPTTEDKYLNKSYSWSTITTNKVDINEGLCCFFVVVWNSATNIT